MSISNLSDEDFFELSEKEVKELNGSVLEEAREAWRAGFDYVCKHIEKCSNTLYNSEFCNEMVELSENKHEIFK